MTLDVGTRVKMIVSWCKGHERVLLGKVATITGHDESPRECVYYELDWGDPSLNEDFGCYQSDAFREVK